MDQRDFENRMRNVFYTDHGLGQCKRLVVKHMTSSRKTSGAVLTINVPEPPTETDLHHYIGEIFSAVEDDAASLGGVQRYTVQAYFEGSTDPFCRIPIRINAEDEFSSDAIDSEPPTKTGVLSQLMRHNEAIMRTSNASLTQVLATLQRSNTQLSHVVEKLTAEKMDTVELVESLMSRQHERELQAREQEQKSEIRAELLKKTTGLLPVVANRIAGKQVMAANDPRKEMLKSFYSSLGDDQVAALLQVLKPEQAMLLAEIGKSVDDNPENEKPNLKAVKGEKK